MPPPPTSELEGFGIPVSYDRLREACQADVDGTSVDTLEGNIQEGLADPGWRPMAALDAAARTVEALVRTW